MNEFAETSVTDLFARDGHLTMLSLDRFDQGELSLAGCEAVLDHLQECPLCELRHAQIQDHDVDIPPPLELLGADRPAAPLPLHRIHRIHRTMAVATTVAAAAVLLVLALPRPEEAYRRASEHVYTAGGYSTTSDGAERSGELEIFDATSERRIESHDRLPLDAPIRLNVSMGPPRHAAVLSATIDAGGKQDPALELLLPPTDTPLRTWTTTVEGANKPVSQRRFVLISCNRPFTLEPSQDAVDMLSSDTDCAAQEITIEHLQT